MITRLTVPRPAESLAAERPDHPCIPTPTRPAAHRACLRRKELSHQSRSGPALDDQCRLRRLDFLDGTRLVHEIHCVSGRCRGYGVLVDNLLLSVAIKQHAESVKTGNDAPQPYAIAQKNRDRRSFPLQMLEERILKTMNIIVCHSALISGLVS